MISLRDVVTGFGSRDPLAEVWRRSLRGGGGGSAVISGVPPLRYIGDGRPLTDYLISGNTVQDGTPSADAPMDAVGSGVRTGNLFDENTIEVGGLSQSTGEETTGEVSRRRSGFIPVLPNTQYTISRPRTGTSSYMWLLSYGDDKSYIGVVGAVGDSDTFVTRPQTHFLRWYTTQAYDYTSVMLNTGSTALPYEPYGFKFPLTVNGVEYPIYLGTVPTTRRVKKLVLTGEENWKIYTSVSNTYRVSISNTPSIGNPAMCSHFVNSPIAQIAPGKFTVGSTWIYIRYADVADLAAFKSYLAAQYAAGMPVTVWYVLADPETAVVNEPLMKIGDYADTVSAAQAGVTIPTIDGENILDVPTEVPPSEVTIKGGISSV